jgi:hypothetical protein
VFTHRDETTLFQTLRERFHESDNPVEFESHLQTKHGGRRRIAWRYQPVREAKGRLPSVVATGIDITERYEAQEQLAEAQRKAAKATEEIAEPEQVQATTSPPDPALAKDPPPTMPFCSLPEPLNAERRQRPRRSYPYSQRIAPIVQGRLPSEQDFREIECNDIAAGGFSFFATQTPISDSLVVALGAAPKTTYLTAQVAHITRLTRNGRRMYLIGCSYTGRIHY